MPRPVPDSVQIPKVTHHSQPCGPEGTVFSVYIAFLQPPDPAALHHALAVGFGSCSLAPVVLEEAGSGGRAFSVTVRAPSAGVAAPGYGYEYAPTVPVSLIVSQPGIPPSQLAICQYTYKAALSQEYGYDATKGRQVSQPTLSQLSQSSQLPQMPLSQPLSQSQISQPLSQPLSQISQISQPSQSSPTLDTQTENASSLADPHPETLAPEYGQPLRVSVTQPPSDQFSYPAANHSSTISVSPADTSYSQPSQYHATPYLDPAYARAPQPPPQPQPQQPPVYYQNSSYYQPHGYDLGAYDNEMGWGLAPFAQSYYQPRVVGGQGVQPVGMVYGQLDTAVIPQLVRTTALSQATMSLGLGGMGHDPLVSEATKASLEIVGNLEHMTQGWSEQEHASRRRLVRFKRTQRGPVVSVEFVRLEASAWNNSTPCISCIYWEEKKECFVTSVDCITLLEQLINNKFTVEEKNRIRRNLEGYHPLTVSKGKASSSEFFKVIMAFDKPKPRNIEKDVKVFQWSLLGKALQKIVGKYSADYGGHAVTLGYGSGAYRPVHPIIPLQHAVGEYQDERAPGEYKASGPTHGWSESAPGGFQYPGKQY